MLLFDHILDFITPHNCVGCGRESRLLCSGCQTSLEVAEQRCYRCQQPAGGWQTCKTCCLETPLRLVRSYGHYGGIAKDLVWALKFGHAPAAAQDMARLLAPCLPRQPFYLVPVPTAPARVRLRGYDQARLLAAELSKLTGLPMLELLARSGVDRQVGKSRQQRQLQMRQAYRVRQPKVVHDRSIILVDDVITTGATLEAAARVLAEAGARIVTAVTFAQA